MRIAPVLAVLALLALATALAVVPFLVWLRRRRNTFSADEVAGLIDRLLEGSIDPREWSDFVSCPVVDPALEAIRARCAALPREFPPRSRREYCGPGGRDVLRHLAGQLHGRPGAGTGR